MTEEPRIHFEDSNGNVVSEIGHDASISNMIVERGGQQYKFGDSGVLNAPTVDTGKASIGGTEFTPKVQEGETHVTASYANSGEDEGVALWPGSRFGGQTLWQLGDTWSGLTSSSYVQQDELPILPVYHPPGTTPVVLILGVISNKSGVSGAKTWVKFELIDFDNNVVWSNETFTIGSADRTIIKEDYLAGPDKHHPTGDNRGLLRLRVSTKTPEGGGVVYEHTQVKLMYEVR